jgi:GTPase
MDRTPLIAIAGRPNVGKSTLFNRLVGGRPAMVHDTPGLTRDRRYGELDYYGRRLRVVDTGGLDPEAEREVIGAGIHRQARAAIDESDLVVFVVDAAAGITALDREAAAILRRTGRPVVVAANKVDHAKREVLAAEAHALGLGEVFAISAVHGRGVDELVEAIIELLALPPPAPITEDQADEEGDDDADDDPDRPIRVAFIGKPNAGKSSLVNRLVGAERSLVHDMPGTTTDPVDTPFELGGRRYVLVDTAGIRRKARIDEEVERISVSMALAQIRRADVAVLVLDVAEGAAEQDARLAGIVEETGRALVVALNKVDLLGGVGAGKTAAQKTTDVLHFVPWARTLMISALRGDGVGELMAAVDAAAVQNRRRISTSELNDFFAEVCETHPPPIHRGRPVRVHYLTQAAARPPTFLLFANRREGISESYRRFVLNQLRRRYGFDGTPIRVVIRSKSDPKKKRTRR